MNNQNESDGDVTISSSVTITKPMNYASLTITPNGQLICDGIGVKTKELDLTNAPVDGLKLGGENRMGGAAGCPDISNGRWYLTKKDENGNFVKITDLTQIKEPILIVKTGQGGCGGGKPEPSPYGEGGGIGRPINAPVNKIGGANVPASSLTDSVFLLTPEKLSELRDDILNGKFIIKTS
jgi:hypothetical protein